MEKEKRALVKNNKKKMKKMTMAQIVDKRDNAMKDLLKVEREIFEEETNYL